MRLTLVRILLEGFGQKILNQTINQAELLELMAEETFSAPSRHPVYEHDLSDDNYTRSEAIQLFILGLANIEGMQTESLLVFVLRMIQLLPNKIPEKHFPSKIPPLILPLMAYLYAANHNNFKVIFNALEKLGKKINFIESLRNRKIVPSTAGGGQTLIQHAANQLSGRLYVNIRLGARPFQELSPRLIKAMRPHKSPSPNAAQKSDSLTEQMKSLRTSIATSVHRQPLIDALLLYKAHYNNPATQAHQRVFHSEKITAFGTSQAAAKAAVANNLINALESFTNMDDIRYVFLNSLQTYGLMSNGQPDPQLFFVGTKTKVQLAKKFEDFLSSAIQHEAIDVNPIIPDVIITVSAGASELDDASTTEVEMTTANPLGQITAAVDDPNSASLSSTASAFTLFASTANPRREQNDFLSNLKRFYHHYNSTGVQMLEKLERKKNTAPAKARVANGLIEFMDRNGHTDIGAEFRRLLGENGITETDFFAGKSGQYLTEENKALLTPQACSLEL